MCSDLSAPHTSPPHEVGSGGISRYFTIRPANFTLFYVMSMLFYAILRYFTLVVDSMIIYLEVKGARVKGASKGKAGRAGPYTPTTPPRPLGGGGFDRGGFGGAGITV